MTRYFEKNFFAADAADIKDVGGVLWTAFQTLCHNVEVKTCEPHLKRRCIEGREAEIEKKLAGSALMMIGACEALLSKLDPEAVEAAGEDAERKLARDVPDDLGDLLRAALGIE